MNDYIAPLEAGDGIDYSDRFNTEELFPTKEHALEWCRAVALEIGFYMNISSHKGQTKFMFRCNRGEPYRGKGRDVNGEGRRSSKTQRCGCPFSVKCEWQDGGFKILPRSGENGMHNHKFILYPEGHPHHNKFSEESAELVRKLRKARTKPQGIMVALKDQFPNEKHNPKQIYNMKAKIRREEFEDRDVMG